jgi:methionine biosynthesis protein MetW
MNDNRKYNFALRSTGIRAEYSVIRNWIPKGSRVLDLGCGDGSLLKYLIKKKISGEGVEISESGVQSAKYKKIKARRGRADEVQPFKDKEFDYAICNVTLPVLMYPEVCMSEMRRVSKKQIISFSNFGFFDNRIDLLINGRMPRPMLFGYKWHTTGLIHQLSIADFEDYCRKNGYKITKKYFFIIDRFGPIPKFILSLFPNMWAITGIYMLE